MTVQALQGAAERRAEHRLGLALIAGSTLAWSTAGFFSRLIDVDVWTMLFWRGVFGGSFIAAFALWQHRRNVRALGRAFGPAGLAVAALSAAGMVMFLTSLELTSVADVSVIYATLPLVTAAVAFFALGERASRLALAAGVVALAGVAVMVAGATGGSSLAGDLLAFAMVVSVAGMIAILRRHREVPMIAAAALSAFLCSAVTLPFASPATAGAEELAYLALFGVTQMGLGLILFTIGSRHVTPVENALLGALDAPIAPLWVWLAFGEAPGTATVAGGIVVFAAVGFYLSFEYGRGRPPQLSA
jgi:drug/metabolite transporter (DMT)-like permease